MTNAMNGQLVYPGEIRRYVLGGNATFTLQNTHTGERTTYKVKSATHDKYKNWSTGNQDRSLYFVSYLTGGDNENSYTYLMTLRKHEDGYYITRLSGKSPQNNRALEQFGLWWKLLEMGCRVDPLIEFWHEGVCCMCGRKLTVPSSVEAGIGPECASKGE